MPSKPSPITMDAVYTAPGYLFRRMQQIAVSIFVEECKAFDLTPVQYAALVAIHTHPGIDATRLSAVIAFDRSTLGNVIERLESKALIERKPSREDKRVKLLHLTKSGAAVLRDIMPSVERAQLRMLQPLEAGRPQDPAGAADAARRSQQRSLARAAARRRRAGASGEGGVRGRRDGAAVIASAAEAIRSAVKTRRIWIRFAALANDGVATSSSAPGGRSCPYRSSAVPR